MNSIQIHFFINEQEHSESVIQNRWDASLSLLVGVLALIPSEPRSFVLTTCLLNSPLYGEVDLSTCFTFTAVSFRPLIVVL
jgi:hypothetical protein